jgi:hypothetical protein
VEDHRYVNMVDGGADAKSVEDHRYVNMEGINIVA